METIKFIRAIKAYSEIIEEAEKSKRWHTEECACQRCRDIEEWENLSWWERIKTKVIF